MNKCRTRSKVAAKKRFNRKQSVTLHRIATLKPGVRKRILSASSLADQPEDTKRKKKTKTRCNLKVSTALRSIFPLFLLDCV